MEKRKNILDYNVEWLKFAETKATLLITVLGLILTIIYSNSNDVYNGIMQSKIQIVFSALSGLFFVLALLFCFLTINPSLKNIISDSVIYFGTIVNYKTFKEFDDKLNNLTDEEYKKMLSEQIYVNSKISWKKYTNVGWAIRFFSIMILFMFIQVLIYIF